MESLQPFFRAERITRTARYLKNRLLAYIDKHPYVPGAPPFPDINESPPIGTQSGPAREIGRSAALLEKISRDGIESVSSDTAP